MPRYPAITLKPIQRVPLLPLLPSFIVFYYRGCLEFLVRAILRGGIAIPCLSTALLVRSDNGRESVPLSDLCIRVHGQFFREATGWLVGAGKGEPRELEIGGTDRKRRGGRGGVPI